jgi:hypothetical protein
LQHSIRQRLGTRANKPGASPLNKHEVEAATDALGGYPAETMAECRHVLAGIVGFDIDAYEAAQPFRKEGLRLIDRALAGERGETIWTDLQLEFLGHLYRADDHRMTHADAVELGDDGNGKVLTRLQGKKVPATYDRTSFMADAVAKVKPARNRVYYVLTEAGSAHVEELAEVGLVEL